MGWKNILRDWTEAEAELHLASGRIITKEDPTSHGVWLFKDTQDISGTKVLEKKKEMCKNSTSEDIPEDHAANTLEWGQRMNQFSNAGSFNDTTLFGGKGVGKGSSSSSAAGVLSVKGKGKGHTSVLAIEDDPEKKVTAAKTQLKTASNLLMTYLYDNPKAKARSSLIVKELKKLQEEAETHLASGPEDVQSFLATVSFCVKAVKEFVKA